MLHRHLNHQGYTLAAIDDIISRGRQRDWIELHRATLSDPSLLEKILRICQPHLSDQYAQRYFFWMHYVKDRTS